MKSGRRCEGYPAYKRTVDVAIPIAPRPESGDSSTSPEASSSSSNTVRSIKRTLLTPKKKTPAQAQSVLQIQRAIPRVKFVSPTTYRPGGFAFDAQEGQYFQVFQKHTASELSGFFDSEFWTRSVLQESHSEASIRHAVVALGALYKTLESAAESPPTSPNSNNHDDSAPNHYNFALQQYGKALTRLRESLDNAETRSQRTTLISVVLFTCFQSFTGDHKAAIFQIQHGLQMLHERQQESKQPLIQRKEDAVEDELVQMFTRLAIQAKSYDMAFHFPHPYVIRLSPQTEPRADPSSPASPSSPSDTTSSASLEPHIPEVFASLQDARQALDALTERIMRINELLSSFHPGPNNILPKSVQSAGQGFRIQLSQWGTAFEPLLEARRRPGVTNTERAGIDVLKMFHLMTSILFFMGYSTSEMDFDKFAGQFKDIIELAKEVVVDEELTLAQEKCGNTDSCRHKNGTRHIHHFPGLTSHQPGAIIDEHNYSHIKPSFALDLGIVPPLFVVATKCRHRKIRREAIRLLLSSPRREGMWDSILTGRVAQWIMEIEEEGLTPWDGPYGRAALEIVPDEKRVMVKEITFDLQRREATLRCGTRGTMEGDEDRRRRVKNIWW